MLSFIQLGLVLADMSIYISIRDTSGRRFGRSALGPNTWLILFNSLIGGAVLDGLKFLTSIMGLIFELRARRWSRQVEDSLWSHYLLQNSHKDKANMNR